jgi:hypothetical protein
MMLIEVGRDDVRRKQGLKAELDQDPAGIGRQLQPRAGFFEPGGAFHHDNAESACGKRQRGGQSANTRTSDNDSA